MIETITILNIVRLIIGTIILSYASFTDIKTRKASNKLWIIMGATGIIILIIQYTLIGFENYIYLIFIPIMIGLFYILFQFYIIVGGADAKALMTISILVPIQPEIVFIPLLKTLMPFSLVILLNSLILFLLIPIGIFILNIYKKNIKFPHSFLGYKSTIENARNKFVWPLEKIKNGKTKLIIFRKEMDPEKEYIEFEKQNINEIWVTYRIPFMIPLLLGFLFSFFVGDIFSHFLNILI